MRKITFDPEQLTGDDRTWWDEWQERARKATDRVRQQVEAGEAIVWDNSVWSDLKAFLLRVAFNKKCAYCESNVTAGFFGDAEHYRPKGKVTVRADGHNQEVLCGGKPHPGYWWLAYDWRNLLPSCSLCNSASGKMNQFPVGRTHRGPPPLDADDLDREEGPLLLHPYHDNPREHIRFDRLGVAYGVTDRGRNSIDVYDLARDDLRALRQQAQAEAWRAYAAALAAPTLPGVQLSVRDLLGRVMEPLFCGTATYSAAALDYIQLMHDEEDQAMKLVAAGGG